MNKVALERVCRAAFLDELAKIARPGGGQTYRGASQAMAAAPGALSALASKGQVVKDKLQAAAKRLRNPMKPA